MRRERFLFGALAFVLACAISSPAVAQPAASGHETVIGTVCRIDTRGGTLALLTGVGHAFRIHVIILAPGVAVTGRAASAGIAALVPGAVCRVECDVAAAAGPTATRVEVLQPAAGRSQ